MAQKSFDVSKIINRMIKRRNAFKQVLALSLNVPRPKPLDWPFNLWCKGHALHCDTNGGRSNVFAPTNQKLSDAAFERRYKRAKGKVWLRLGANAKGQKYPRGWQIDQFDRLVLPNLKTKITLFTSDGDLDIPDDLDPAMFERIIRNPNIERWYTQNLNAHFMSEKLRPIPIGLDLHAKRGAGRDRQVIRTFREIRAKLDRQNRKRDPRILADCLLRVTHGERETLLQEISSNPAFVTLNDRVSFKEILHLYGTHRFVLSLRGNGRDCYRTWESLMMGAIPIIVGEENFALTHDLPALKIKSHKDLLALTQKDLDRLSLENTVTQDELLERTWF